MDLELIALAALGFFICWWFTVPLVIAAARALHNRQPLRIRSWRAGSVSTDTEHGPIGTVIIGGIALLLALGPVVWILERLLALIIP
jgi:hypothetical protein